MAVVELISTLANVALTIKSHYSTLWSNKKRGKRLNARINALECILKGMENRWKKETAPQGIEGALECVDSQLKSVDALFQELDRKGFLRNLFEAPKTSDKFQEIERSLDYAVNVLDLAHGWHRSQEDEKFQREMLDWKDDMTGKMDQLLEKNTQKLKNPAEHQVESDEVYYRYNQKMMTFLETQLDSIDTVQSLPAYQRRLKQMQMDEGLEQEEKEQRQEWQQSTAKMAHARKLGQLLISRHQKPFNLTTFYKAYEAKKAVEMICEALQTFVNAWGFSSVKIQKVVPPADVLVDRTRLQGYLMYVLHGEECAAIKGEHAKKEWMLIRERTKGWLDMVQMAAEGPDGDLQLGDTITGTVCNGLWRKTKREQRVAVKRLAQEDNPARLDLEDFAEFFTTIAALAHLTSDHIVKIVGATKSGMILMELGRFNLLDWLENHRSAGLAAKLGLLLQAAEGLRDVHEHKFVHRYVRTRKFVIFGSETTPTVKISGFGLAITQQDGASETFRKYIDKDRDTPWVAPEIFDGKAYTAASDIYSFGIVLYHIVSGLYPYGRGTPPGKVSDRVGAGVLPSLPDGMVLPEKLESLMQKCCSNDPAERPEDMQDVCDDLQAVYNALQKQ
eukprot:evm.model.scf_1406EXC.1 EVM.evm.TU.scf_1406EXC.1   scf_1406EXC:27031-30219(+)